MTETLVCLTVAADLCSRVTDASRGRLPEDGHSAFDGQVLTDTHHDSIRTRRQGQG